MLGMAVAPALQTICTLLQTDNHTNTSSLNFHRPDSLPDAQPTVSKHWRQFANYSILEPSGFLPRDAMHPRYGPWACVCLSVCVRLSQVGVLLKRLNGGSQKQHHTIPQRLQFSDAKDLREIRPGSPPTRAPNAGGVGQNRRLSTNRLVKPLRLDLTILWLRR